MGYISSISIDGKEVINDLLRHAKLIKIVKSDKLLVDHLYLIINKADYKAPLPQENSIVELKTSAKGKKDEYKERFYIHKENNIFSSDQLTEREKAIAKEANSIIFYGLSVKPDFINKHNLVDNSTSQPKTYVFKDKTLTEVLEYIKTALGLTKLIINHPLENTKITYFAANRVHKRPDDTYTKTPLEQLAEIFYAVANIRNNTLYFIHKRYSNTYLKHSIAISSEQIQRKERIRGDFADYNGVIYSYFEGSTNNIKHTDSGISPFLKLDNAYEESLAYMYVQSKYREIQEKEIISLTLSDVHNKLPGHYLYIRKSKAKEASDKMIDDSSIGGYSIKDSVITYSGMQQKSTQDPNEAGPSAKKARLAPSWTTSLKLSKVKDNKAQ